MRELIKELQAEITRLEIENKRLVKYADELVEHSNMPCLPADLRNLRKANLHFSMENDKLKKEIFQLKKGIC